MTDRYGRQTIIENLKGVTAANEQTAETAEHRISRVEILNG